MNSKKRWSLAASVAASLAAIASLSSAVPSCAALEAIVPNVCGNGAVDDAEDCDDSFQSAEPARGAQDASRPFTCAKPGQKNQCRYTCTTSADCPESVPACDLNEGNCVRATGELANKPSFTLETGAVRMVAGDFNGDGRQDLVLTQPSGLDGTSTGTAYFFEKAMKPRARTPIPIRIGAIQPLPPARTAGALAPLSNTLVSPWSLGFSYSAGLGVLRGEPEQPFVPELFPFQQINVGTGKARILVCPLPPGIDGSSRGDVAYFVAYKPRGSDGTSITSFDIEAPLFEKPVMTLLQAPVALPGDPADVRSIAGPGGTPLCFLGGTSCGILVWSIKKGSPIYFVDVAPRVVEGPLQPPVASAFEVFRELKENEIDIEAVAVGDVDGDGVDDIVVGPVLKTTPDPRPIVVSGKSVRGPGFVPVSTKAQLPTAFEQGQARTIVEPFVGLADLNGDRIADFIYATTVNSSVRSVGDAGAGPIVRAISYQAGPSAWTQIEHGDFDGDGRMDAILAVKGQPGIEVLRGTTGEIRPLSIPTPGPVDFITAGFFDADRMTDVAYTTRVAGETEALATGYILYGGPENQTVSVGKKSVSQIVNLRRPIPGAFIADVDFLGLLSDPASLAESAIIYAATVPEGRAPVSVLKRATGGSVGGRAVAFGQATAGKLDGVQVVIDGESASGCDKTAELLYDSDIGDPPKSGPSRRIQSAGLPYGASLPIALTSGRIGNEDQIFALTSTVNQLVVNRATFLISNGKVELKPVASIPYDFKCGMPYSTTPQEKLALVDVDDDTFPDLVFSDGGRTIERPKKDKDGRAIDESKGALFVLRNPGNGTFPESGLVKLVGRSFTLVNLGSRGKALAALTPDGVTLYRFEKNVPLPTPTVIAMHHSDARGIEAGDFDGDGIEDIAILAGGVIEIYQGKAAQAGRTRDGGAP